MATNIIKSRYYALKTVSHPCLITKTLFVSAFLKGKVKKNLHSLRRPRNKKSNFAILVGFSGGCVTSEDKYLIGWRGLGFQTASTSQGVKTRFQTGQFLPNLIHDSQVKKIEDTSWVNGFAHFKPLAVRYQLSDLIATIGFTDCWWWWWCQGFLDVSITVGADFKMTINVPLE